jgi:hypothetical protein
VGYRWVNEERQVRERRFFKFLGPVEVRDIYYYIRWPTFITVRRQTGASKETYETIDNIRAYIARDRCYAIEPLKLFEALGIDGSLVRDRPNQDKMHVYEISLNSKKTESVKTVAGGVMVSNVWAGVVLDK